MARKNRGREGKVRERGDVSIPQTVLPTAGKSIFSSVAVLDYEDAQRGVRWWV